MNNLFTAAVALQEFFENQGWEWCLIGGMAVQRWGEPRITRDLDLSLLTGFGSEDQFIEPLLAHFSARIPDAAEFARSHRILLLQTASGVGIDVSLSALPFEEMAVARASYFEFAPGVRLKTCSAEDLLVMKLFAQRPIDVRDAESIVARNADRLDWDYVEEQLRPLAEVKEDPAILETLRRLRRT
jgi:hypothetical protein